LRVEFPRGLDANEYALKVQPASTSLGVALRHARPMGSTPAKAKPSPPPLAAPAAEATALKEEGLAASRLASPPEAGGIPLAEGGHGAAEAAHSPPVAAGAKAPDVDEGFYTFGPRRYRLRGLSKPHPADALRLNVLLSVGDAFHVDTFDMYSAKARVAFVQQASLECGQDVEAVKRDVGQLLLQVEALLDKRREDAKGPKVPTLSEAQRADALQLLRSPDLLGRILEDFTRCGVVGEETNKLVGYLAAVSRKLEAPLAVLIQSSSAAGKSSLMEAVLAFVPEEEKTKFSAMTGQSLFYMGDVSLSHKVLAVVEEEGASRAAYALKLLQSEGELTIASTGKNPTTGRLVTHEYKVEGPTQLFLTTTATELDEELLNRCLVLTVDEAQPQTAAIHAQQRGAQTLEGMLARRAKEAVLTLHKNAQRLLRPLAVVNPYAHQLGFLNERTRARRDFPKYLTLIRAIALLHQYQREVKTATHAGGVVEYVEVQPSDVEAANSLAASVLGRSLDELPPQTRRLLSQLEAYVAQRAEEDGCLAVEVRFTRRQLREAVKAGNTQLKLHLGRLTDFEYLRLHGGARGHDFVYSLREGLAADAAATSQPHSGLTEATSLYDSRMGGLEVRKSGAQGRKSGVAGPWPGRQPDLREAQNPSQLAPLAASTPQVGVNENAHTGQNSAVVRNNAAVAIAEVVR
jgi:hypothetical protein